MAYKRKASYNKGKASRKRGRSSMGSKGARTSYGSGGRRNLRTGGFLGLENKFIDFGREAPVVATMTTGEVSPSTGCLNAIAQGDGQSDRDGRKCVLTSVFVSGHLDLQTEQNNTIAMQPVSVCVALVHDTQTNGTQLNSEDVYTQSGVGSAANMNAYAMRNLQYTSRFNVLWKKTFDMNIGGGAGFGAGGTADWAGDRQSFEFFTKLNIPVIHNGTTSNISNVTDNSLQMIAWCDDASRVIIRYKSRVRFQG